MTTISRPRNFASDPPSARVLKQCDREGCIPQWLPDTMGVEYGPSEKECSRCHRYLKPGSDEPFRNEEEINAWMKQKEYYSMVAAVRDCDLWLLEQESGTKVLIRITSYPESLLVDNTLEFEVVCGGIEEAANTSLSIVEFIKKVTEKKLFSVSLYIPKGRYGHPWSL